MFIRFERSMGKFVWAWNHMLSQRYREGWCVEQFLDFMLSDFRSFCANENNRLSQFVDNFLNPNKAQSSNSENNFENFDNSGNTTETTVEFDV